MEVHASSKHLTRSDFYLYEFHDTCNTVFFFLRENKNVTNHCVQVKKTIQYVCRELSWTERMQLNWKCYWFLWFHIGLGRLSWWHRWSKNPSAMLETWIQVPGLGRSPGEGNGWLPTPVFFPGEFHGQRSLLGYSPWGHNELDRTVGLTLGEGWDVEQYHT